jgi:hypothetical protein
MPTVTGRSLKVTVPLLPGDRRAAVARGPAAHRAAAAKAPPSRKPFYDALIAAITKSAVGPGRTTVETWQLECLRRGLIEKPLSDQDETTPQRRTRWRDWRRAKSDLIGA